MGLDLSSLRKAVNSLESALEAARSGRRYEPSVQDAIRAGVIQNFEFTYELCWKFIQRWLKEQQMEKEADFPRIRKDLFRMAAKHGLVKDPLPWFDYSDARNLTSHTYNEDKAKIVFETAVRFASDAKYLLQQLDRRND